MPFKQKISELMSTNLFTVDVEDTLHQAYELMKKERVRHLPVLEGTKIVGMLCERKVNEYILRKIYEPDQNFGDLGYNRIIDFENIMDKIEHFVYPEDSVAKSVKLATKYKVDALPVVDWEMNLVGLVTQTDLLLSYHKLLEEMQNN